jgi:hypothetical protein
MSVTRGKEYKKEPAQPPRRIEIISFYAPKVPGGTIRESPEIIIPSFLILSFLHSFPGYLPLFLMVISPYFPPKEQQTQHLFKIMIQIFAMVFFYVLLCYYNEVFENNMNNHNRMKRVNRIPNPDLIRGLNRMPVQSIAEIDTADYVY